MNALYVTPEGYQKLIDELEGLKSRRPEIAARIGEAKEQGDLSENAEYQSARDEQSLIESRILELEEQAKGAVVVNHKDSDSVRIGSKVDVEISLDGKKEKKTYFIVGSNESDPMNNRISNESPIAQALLGKKQGETGIAKTPRGASEMKILSLE